MDVPPIGSYRALDIETGGGIASVISKADHESHRFARGFGIGERLREQIPPGRLDQRTRRQAHSGAGFRMSDVHKQADFYEEIDKGRSYCIRKKMAEIAGAVDGRLIPHGVLLHIRGEGTVTVGVVRIGQQADIPALDNCGSADGEFDVIGVVIIRGSLEVMIGGQRDIAPARLEAMHLNSDSGSAGIGFLDCNRVTVVVAGARSAQDDRRRAVVIGDHIHLESGAGTGARGVNVTVIPARRPVIGRR